MARLPDADSAAGSARPSTPPPPDAQPMQQAPPPWDTAAVRARPRPRCCHRVAAALRCPACALLTPRCVQRVAPGSPSFLERAQGITGTRKRLDDALDDAVPCAMTPKRLRGAEDMFAAMRIDA